MTVHALEQPESVSPDPTVVFRERFVDAMSRAVSSVSIVATDGPGGRFGLTVSAFTSVTADPPTMLVCINRRNPICPAIGVNGVFSLNVLRADQQRVAETFSGRPRRGQPYDFSVARWDTMATGSPLLAGSVGRLDCVVVGAHDVGTHTVFIGEVQQASVGHGTPLVYGSRWFGELRALPRQSGEHFSFPEPVWDEPAEEDRTE